MTNLFIQSFLAHDYVTLSTKLQLVIIMWIIVLVAIVIDLISGLRKATLLGEIHTSYGFRRTVSKMVQYYGLLCFAFMFDVLASLIVPMPYFSLMASVFLVFIEAKSVFEKAHDKDRRKMNDSLKDLIALIENKDNLLKGVTQILKNTETSLNKLNDDDNK